MLTLAELQMQFVESLVAKNTNILSVIKPSTQLTAQQHLNIYRSSTQGALQKALQEIFPVCLKLVGENFFIGMANAFIEKTHSISFDIGQYGYHFPEHIRHYAPAQALPYLADVACLEWAWHCVFSGPESSSLDFKELTQILEVEWNRILFLLPTNLFLLESHYPIHRIWQVNQDTFTDDPTIELTQPRLFYFIIWRQELVVHIDELTYFEWRVLHWLKAGLTIAEVCDNITFNFPNGNIVVLLPQLVSKKWISGFKLRTGEVNNGIKRTSTHSLAQI